MGLPSNHQSRVVRLPGIDGDIRQGWRRGLAALDTFGYDVVQAALVVAWLNAAPRLVMAQLVTTILATEGRQNDLRLIHQLVDRMWINREAKTGGCLPDQTLVSLPTADSVVRHGWRSGCRVLQTYENDPSAAAVMVASREHWCRRDLAHLATAVMAAELRHHDIRMIAEIVDQFADEEVD